MADSLICKCGKPKSKSHGSCWECRNAYARTYRQKYLYVPGADQQIKNIARSQAAVAVKRGLIVRQPCVICGSPEAQMHHNDYSKPLEVVWFCLKHHKAWHRKYPAVLPAESPVEIKSYKGLKHVPMQTAKEARAARKLARVPRFSYEDAPKPKKRTTKSKARELEWWQPGFTSDLRE